MFVTPKISPAAERCVGAVPHTLTFEAAERKRGIHGSSRCGAERHHRGRRAGV